MNRFMLTVLFTLTVLLITQTGYAEASVWDTFKDSMGLQVLAYAIGGVILLAGLQKYTSWLSNVFLGVGVLFTHLGLALADGKLTKEELKQTKEDIQALIADIKAKKSNGGTNG